MMVSTSAFAARDMNLRGWHRVTGVAAGDVLNVRNGPSASSQTIGGYKPGEAVFATGEYLQKGSSRWLKVNIGEILGWVSGQYLRKAQMTVFQNSNIPLRGRCYGFEPGWLVEWAKNKISFSQYETKITAEIQIVSNAVGHTDPGYIIAKSDMGELRLLLTNMESCTGGGADMDEVKGIVFLKTGTGEAVYNGCCRADESVIR